MLVSFGCGTYYCKIKALKRGSLTSDTKGLVKHNAFPCFVVSLVLAYPTISRQAFMMFQCIFLDPINRESTYLIPDLTMKCYGAEHLKWLTCVGMPSHVTVVALLVIGVFFITETSLRPFY